MSALPESQPNWAAHRTKIKDLYWDQDMTLPEVMKIMKEMYGFVATKKMFKKNLKAWGLDKNHTTAESLAMIRIAERRRLANKQTVFYRRGRLVEPGKLRRFAKRHKLMEALPFSDLQVATPPDITYATPEPDRSSNSPQPNPQPDLDPEAIEGDQGAMDECADSQGLESDGSSPSGVISWDPSPPGHWPSDSPYLDPRGPSDTGIGAHFIPNAFSAPTMQEMSHHFPGNNMGPPSLPAGLDHTEPPGPEYQATIIGPPSWPFVSEPPQHAANSLANNLNHTVADFDYNPDMGYATLALSSSFNHSGPHTPGCILDHTPLHDAIVNRDFDSAEGLLLKGVNPNCSTRGGMTPLHYAAYQRDVRLVRLLMDHGANLDAMTDKSRSVLFFAVRGRRHLTTSDSSDMLAYGNPNRAAADFLTDDATLRVLDTLFDGPSGWIRLCRSFEKPDRDGTTPLMVAAGEGFEGTVELFLQRRAQPDARDHAGHTALKYAARANHRKLVRLLLEADEEVFNGNLAHLLKLASKNFTAARVSSGGHHNHQQVQGKEDGQTDGWWDNSRSSMVIAEEMVRLCREMGLLEGLLTLAEQRCKTGVLRRLVAAQGQLEMEMGIRGEGGIQTGES
ncbi:hypothetical protein VTI74DRAFT_490 [Chaetomium olivicolor]